LYKLTEKGLHYLSAFDQMNDIISIGSKSSVQSAVGGETVSS